MHDALKFADNRQSFILTLQLNKDSELGNYQ